MKVICEKKKRTGERIEPRGTPLETRKDAEVVL